MALIYRDPVAKRFSRSNSVLITDHVGVTLGCKRKVIHFEAPPVRTLADMDELEILMLEFGYGCPVVLPEGCK